MSTLSNMPGAHSTTANAAPPASQPNSSGDNSFPNDFINDIDPRIWAQIPANRSPFSTRGRRGRAHEASTDPGGDSTRPDSSNSRLPNGLSTAGHAPITRASASPNRARELPPPLSQQGNGHSSFFGAGQSASSALEPTTMTFGQTSSMYNIAQAASSSRASSRPRLGSSGVDGNEVSFFSLGRDYSNQGFQRNSSQAVSQSNSQAVSRNSSLPPSRHGVDASPTEPNFSSIVNPNDMRPAPATNERPGSGGRQHPTVNFGQLRTARRNNGGGLNATGPAQQTFPPVQSPFNSIGNRPSSGNSTAMQPSAPQIADQFSGLSIGGGGGGGNISFGSANEIPVSSNGGFHSGSIREQNLQPNWEIGSLFASSFNGSGNNGSSASPQMRNINTAGTRTGGSGGGNGGGGGYLNQLRQDRNYGQTFHGQGVVPTSATAFNQYSNNPWSSPVQQQQQPAGNMQRSPRYVGGAAHQVNDGIMSSGYVPGLPQQPRLMAGGRQTLPSVVSGNGSGRSSLVANGHQSIRAQNAAMAATSSSSSSPAATSAAQPHFSPGSVQETLYSGNNWTERVRSNNGQKYIETTPSCTLADVLEHVARFCGDQAGSRFLQDKLEGANSDEKEMVFKELLPNTIQLSSDPFGNYVIQKFFEHGTQRQKEQLANKMRGKVKDLSTNMYGCRCIQKAFEYVLCDQQALLVRELKPCLYDVSQDQHGNHVVQKAISRLRRQDIGFIIHGYYDRVLDMSNNSYGCRVIQRLLEVDDDEELRSRLTAEIRRNTLSLVRNPYGNYVVQHVIEHGRPEDREFVVRAMLPSTIDFMTNKFSSNVVEKAIRYGTEEQLVRLINELALSSGNNVLSNGTKSELTNLRVVMNNNFGNYVIQRMLKSTPPSQWDRFSDMVKGELDTMLTERGGVPDKKMAEFQKLLEEGPFVNRQSESSEPFGNGSSARRENRASRASTINSQQQCQHHHHRSPAHIHAANTALGAAGGGVAIGHSMMTSTPPLLTGGESSPQSDGAPSTGDNTLINGTTSHIPTIGNGEKEEDATMPAF